MKRVRACFPERFYLPLANDSHLSVSHYSVCQVTPLNLLHPRTKTRPPPTQTVAGGIAYWLSPSLLSYSCGSGIDSLNTRPTYMRRFRLISRFLLPCMSILRKGHAHHLWSIPSNNTKNCQAFRVGLWLVVDVLLVLFVKLIHDRV